MLVRPFDYSTWDTYLGTIAQEHRINITSNNLANINTPGFKRDVPVFEGYMVKASKTDFRQGIFQQTENPLDLALSGPGFFQIETPQGIRYTRNGSFTLTSDGNIVTMDGNPVVGGITIPPGTTRINITSDGMVYANGQIQGQLEIVEFEDLNLLAKEGNDLFATKIPDIAGQPGENTTVEQGYIERSNVDPVMESVNMIDTLRTYEVFQKIAQSIQDIDDKSINEVGRLV